LDYFGPQCNVPWLWRVFRDADIHAVMDVVSRIGEVMLRSRREGGRLLAAAFAVAVLFGGAPAAALPGTVSVNHTAVSHGGVRASQNGQIHTVTLITGDVLRVAAGDRVSVVRGRGREHISFASYRSHGHLHVIPSDARPLVAAGRLDSRLFDVTSLIEFGYDERRAELPLIVVAKGTPAADSGLRLTRGLKAVHGSAGQARKDRLGALWQGLTGKDRRAAAQPLATAKIWLDGVRRPTLDVSVPLIGAPAAWQAGYTGAGVKVAVLDTGIDETHPDLAGKVVARQNFAAAEYPDEDDRDHVGHGTHVASTIAGSGAASGGKYRGVAPDAQLLNGKVCVDVGCAESWILAGMQWAADQGADVVNMSLGGGDTPEIDPLEQAVNDITAQDGVLFVIAAGNEGYFGDHTVSSPASADAALAVAATTKSDGLAEFSSRGPRVGDGGLKPEIGAPGEDIVAARSSVGFLGEPGELYMTLSGTSMATPHTVGAAALLAQEHPQWTPAQLKAALMAAAKPLAGIGAYGQGAGRLDVARAIGQTITADTPSVGFGTAQWPHSDDAPIAKTVTFHNSGAAAVTLDMSVRTIGPGDGAGLFSLSATTVTVPAAGSASVTFTADTRAEVPDGLYSGQLVGAANGVSVSVPFGVEKEVESYNLTLKHIQRDGAPSDNHLTIVNSGVTEYLFFAGAEQTIRLPKGEYFVNSWIDDLVAEPYSTSMLIQPKLVVAGDVTQVLDATTAKPVSARVPDPAAQNVGLILSADYTLPDGSGAGFALIGEEGAAFSALVGPDTTVAGLQSAVSSAWATPGPDGTWYDAPSWYNLAWFFPGTFPTGLDKHPATRELATVKTRFHQHTEGVEALVFSSPTPADNPFGGGWAVGVPFHTPLKRTVYYNTDGVAWQDNYEEYDSADESGGQWAVLSGPRRVYTAGKTTRESWNAPVFGPAFGAATYPWEFVVRNGDHLLIGPPLYSDGAGHAGFSNYTAAKTTLYRNGEKIAEGTDPFLDVEVPPEAAQYRVEMEIARDARYTTKLITAWSFRSGHVEPGEGPFDGYARMPVTSVTFTPDVDDRGLAAATPVAMVPITVAAQPDSGAAALKKLTVDYSTNDGRSWRPVAVVNVGSAWYAFIPQKAGSVISLRAHGVDAGGVAVDETIIRAYQVK
jgi:subtilisin family serine protease